MPRKATPPIYDRLVAEAGQVGWPRLFQTDLTVHDRRALVNCDPQTDVAFVWVLREHGTHIYFIQPEQPNTRDWILGLMRYHQRHERARWYIGHVARGTLEPTTPEEAIQRYLAAQPQEQPAAPTHPWQPDWGGLLYGAAAG